MRPPARKDQIQLPSQAIELINSVGEFIEYWGFKAVEGKIWCALYLANRPLDATQIMERLFISKGLVSMSIKRLLEYGVIHDAGKSSYGTQLYRSAPDLVEVILQVLKVREMKLLEQVQHNCDSVEKMGEKELVDIKMDPKQISNLKDFTSQALLLLGSLVDTRSGDLESMFNFDSLIETDIQSIIDQKKNDDQSKKRSLSSSDGSLH